MSQVQNWPEIDGIDGIQTHFRELIKTLEELCDDPGLLQIRSRKPGHPAVAIYDVLAKFVATGQIPLGGEFQHVRAAARLVLDRMTWAIPPDVGHCLERITDQRMRRFVTSRARDHNAFDDIGAELYFWGWLTSNGFRAQIEEIEGMPDVHIMEPLDLWAEVKRIKPGTSSLRVRDVLKKASRQIKKADPDGVGVVFMHVDRTVLPEPLGAEEIPRDVQDRIDQVQRTLLSGLCRSVGVVVVAWDEVFVGYNERDASTHYAARRNSVVLRHGDPRSEFPLEPERFKIGATALMRLRHPALAELLAQNPTGGSMGIAPESVRFTGEFKGFNKGIEKIQEARIVKALHEADSISFHLTKGLLFFVATRIIDITRNPYVMIIIGFRTGKRAVAVCDAYRIYGTEHERHRFGEQPMLALEKLLEDFGIIVQVGERIGKLVPFATVKRKVGENAPVFGLVDDRFEQSADGVISGGVDTRFRFMERADPEDPTKMDIVWAYAVDLERYRVAILARKV